MILHLKCYSSDIPPRAGLVPATQLHVSKLSELHSMIEPHSYESSEIQNSGHSNTIEWNNIRFLHGTTTYQKAKKLKAANHIV